MNYIQLAKEPQNIIFASWSSVEDLLLVNYSSTNSLGESIGKLFIFDPKNNNRLLDKEITPAGAAHWSPDGQYIYITRTYPRVQIDIYDLEGQSYHINPYVPEECMEQALPVWSQDGQIAYVNQVQSQFQLIVDNFVDEPVTIDIEDGNVRGIDWSPDSRSGQL